MTIATEGQRSARDPAPGHTSHIQGVTPEGEEPKQSQQAKNTALITKDPAPPLAHEVLGATAPRPDTECLPLHQMPFLGGREAGGTCRQSEIQSIFFLERLSIP